jgi:hypothetical protein
MKKIITAITIVGILFAATGCTPKQLESIEKHFGIKITAEEKRELLKLPDIPVILDGRRFNTDGSVETFVAPSWSKCPQHYGAALQAGWSPSDWDKIDYIMWRESRCIPTVHTDIRKGHIFRNDDSWGLMQINLKAHRKWVSPIVNGDFTKLFDPVVNLSVARNLYFQAVDYYGCGWRPWSTRNKSWC